LTATKCIGLAAAIWLAAAAGASADSRMLEDVDYGAGAGEARLDLYLPDDGDVRAPLLVFVHSRFWEPGTRDHEIASGLARPLQRAGAAVAIVSHRPSAEPHPAAAKDVATALAHLLERVDALGLDPERIVLAGHGSGGHLAALVALDPDYLAPHGLDAARLRGVAAISGVYDLRETHGSEDTRALRRRVFGSRSAQRDASPLHHVRADAPTFILLAAQHDAPGARDDAEAFAAALREAGHPAAEALFIGGRDHWTQLDMREEANPLRRHLLAMLEIDESWGSIEDVIGTRRFWRDPTLSTAGFWESGVEVTRYESDERLLHTANLLFAKPGRPRPLQPRHYHAIDLLAFVERRAREIGTEGDYLTLTNVRGEQVVWRISELRPFAPVIVVGLDDERELFRLTDVYHTLRRYTWKDPDPVPWVLARPLGAFVYFREAPPPSLDPNLFGRFGLLPGSFARTRDDPLAPLRSLPEPVRSMVTEEFRCVSCHQLRGVGPSAGHLRATDATRVGGFALALEAYPPEVWRRYCFEQEAVAAEIGASVVALGDRAALLYELVVAERERRAAPDPAASAPPGP